ncbi:MAG TPA: tRNA (adenosine(37)-N6)-threonylcarbamoyltransferase complex dimerization subunit type 1 TsaB [Candidatus Enterenecus stercoripullorum]|nr:tRNA (adenosine(37)-N6)-threonylcarbamoyltransferase complex dimerization subunit type 1 TsaB [Candidatus Enterenecus stercoripullorum]
MKILALETSAVTASVAVTQEDKLLAQSFQNSGLTHSATLMPMVANLLENTGLKLEEMDVIAAAVGPGSFTGVRIGVAAAKGLAWPGDKLCAPCSTLESMAWQCAHLDGEICAVMDARRSQVYNARFLARDGMLTRLTPDRAVGLEELAGEVNKSGRTQILVGDGAALCYNAFKAQGIPAKKMPPHLIYQTAWGVARTALRLARDGALVPAGQLTPQYHRLSQAERERLERLGQNQS